jgi:hypothetical protein
MLDGIEKGRVGDPRNVFGIERRSRENMLLLGLCVDNGLLQKAFSFREVFGVPVRKPGGAVSHAAAECVGIRTAKKATSG